MNPMLLNFFMMIFWAAIALFMLVLGPLFAPDMVPDKGRGTWLGYGALLFVVWNFIRVWSLRSYQRDLRKRELTYREQRNPKPASNEPKPILHPEFQFDDAARPPTPPKGGPYEQHK
jgi:hypothetical protein